MTIGQRLRRAMERAGLTQKDVAALTGLQTATVSDVMNDRSSPSFETVEKMARAIGATFSELFDEPRIQLSHDDAELAKSFGEFLQRLLKNDAAQKAIAQRNGSVPTPRPRRSRPSSTPTTAPARIYDAPRNANHEVENLPNEPIPEAYYRSGANRAFRVITDAMIGRGILQGALIYVRATMDVASADGEIIVCTLNKTLYLKRLDLRGGQKALESANPRYPTLFVLDDDKFELIGVVVLTPTA